MFVKREIDGNNYKRVPPSPMDIFFSNLAVLFIGLKLTGYIDWSWWLILAPLYVPLIILIIIYIVFWFLIG